MSKETVEQYFLRFAYPCTFVKVSRGDLSEEEQSQLEEAAKGKLAISRERLTEVYGPAVARITEVAKQLKKKTAWDKDAIAEYFCRRHNDLIDAGIDSWAKMPPTLRDLCKIRKVQIANRQAGIYIVTFTENGIKQTRTVVSSLCPDCKVGQSVWIHYGYACMSVD